MRNRRTAVLVRCTKDEAAAIRWAARRERRTISAFILNALDSRIQSHGKILARMSGSEASAGPPPRETRGDLGPKQADASTGRRDRQEKPDKTSDSV